LGRGALVGAALLAFSCIHAGAQTKAAQSNTEQKTRVPARVMDTVDDTNRTVLRGNVHPKARAEFDGGAVADATPVTRILMVLQRGAEQEAALRQLMEEQQTKNSPNYHAWLTPEDFGKKFGPADADVQTVTDWLTSHGFQNIKVAKGKTVVEFSGNAGQVRKAFATEIHKYNVNGEEHFANASDPQIPVALAPVVAGVASLHDFRKRAYARRAGTFRRIKATGEVKPLFTTSTGCGANGTTQCLALGPADFAKIYNSAPLLSAGVPIDGTGQSIAIVGRTNINLTDVQQFRSIFGLPANFTSSNIILNGPDPGVTSSGEEIEADLDVQWSGSVAPMAQILFVVTESPQSTTATDGVDLSALYIVDNNIAPVLSDSFGSCESAMVTGGNALYNAMWQQAAAQGITVVVAAGDDGSAGCDPSAQPNAATLGLAVSGTASTPFNVAMGGTDFDQVGKTSTFWSTTNSTLPYTGQTPLTELSAIGYIPETTWNDSCASGGQASNCTATKINSDQQSNPGVDVVAGSGGPSSIYAKPSWQAVTGVPGDGRRDLPDVSLFASDGNNGSSYVVCQADANSGTGSSTSSCDLNSPFLDFQLVGGTSAATPTFAGIMALVNQKTGQRQGNANYVLYALANNETFANCNSTTVLAGNACVFYDVTKGNNSVACSGGSSNCSNTASGQFGIIVSQGTPAFKTSTGYDLATGLGSVNIANLVNSWTSISRSSATVALTSSTTFPIAHGSPASFTVNLTPATATGDVSLIAEPVGAAETTVGPFTLGSGAVTFSTNLLPGGTYPVFARYGGSASLAVSDSPPINVTIGTEASKTVLSFVTFDANNNPIFHTPGSGNVSVSYGSSYILRVDVTNNAATQCAATAPVATTPIPCPTGTVRVTDNSNPLNDFGGGNNTVLNNQGFFEDQSVQLSAGTHGLAAAYAGDNSYVGSTSATEPVTVTQATTSITVTPSPKSIAAGGSVTLTALVSTPSNGEPPCGSGVTNPGTVQFKNGSTVISGTVSYSGTSGAVSANNQASCTATLTTSLSQFVPLSRPQPWLRMPLVPLWILAAFAILILALAQHAVPLQRKWPRLGNRLGYAAAGLVLFACLAASFAGCSGSSSGGGGGGGGSHTDSITAAYSGDTNYSGSTATAVSVTIQ